MKIHCRKPRWPAGSTICGTFVRNNSTVDIDVFKTFTSSVRCNNCVRVVFKGKQPMPFIADWSGESTPSKTTPPKPPYLATPSGKYYKLKPGTLYNLRFPQETVDELFHKGYQLALADLQTAINKLVKEYRIP